MSLGGSLRGKGPVLQSKRLEVEGGIGKDV